MAMKFLISILLLTLPGFSSMIAQDSLRWQEVRSLFAQNESVWFNYYKGYDNIGNQFLLILANNQSTEKGILYQLNRTEKWSLEGPYHILKSKYLITQNEYNIWGNGTADKKDSICNLKMISKDLKNSYDLRLRQVNKNNFHLSECPYNLIYKVYGSDSNSLSFQYQTFEDGVVHGYLYNALDSSVKFVSGLCKDPTCKSMELVAFSTNNWVKESLQLKFLNDGELQILFEDKSLKKLKQVKQMGFSCRSYFNPNRTIQARYLALDQRSYQKWVQEFIQNWINSSVSKNHTALDSTANNKLNFDVAWSNNYFLSGSFFWNESGYRQLIHYPFNFNLKSGEIIQLSDLFEKNSDYKYFIKQYIDSTKQILSARLNKKSSEFVEKDPFNYWILLPTGICFFTELHPLYGLYRILVPYRKLDYLLRKNSFVRKMN